MPEYPHPELAGGRLIVDLGALVSNWQLLAKLSKQAECAAVVKANAYGCGIEGVVEALFNAGCRTFFVALPEEGIRGTGSPVLRVKRYVCQRRTHLS